MPCKYSLRLHVRAVRGAIVALFLTFLTACLVFLASPALSSAASNAVGATFSIDYTDEAEGVSGSITYKVTAVAQDNADGTKTPGEVEVFDGGSYAASEQSPALQLDTVEYEGYQFYVTSVKYGAFEGNQNIYRVVFSKDLTGISEKKTGQLATQRRAIGYRAFYNCGNLASVEFNCSRVNGIGTESFYRCSKLSSVTFAEDMEIFSSNSSFGIGERAFCDCALTSFEVPVITCALRTGNYYSEYSHNYELLPEERDESGYQGCWHAKLEYFGIEQVGICSGAFSGNPLESITFKAGNEVGLFAYWNAAGAGLWNISTLKSVIYEAAQPYYGNPFASMNNGTVKNVWDTEASEGDETGSANPDFYYAVDYYTTQAQADVADSYGSTRLARVEYKRNTPTSLIQAGDAAAYEYAYPADYASTAFDEQGNAKYTDGVAPNPKDAAVAAQQAGEAGFENADQYDWLWMLDDTQSRRGGLTDSCKAYLVRSDSLAAGRIATATDGADQIATMYQLCDQNMSQSFTQNSAFDYKRYYDSDSVYVFDEDKLETYIRLQVNNMSDGKTPWFHIDSTGLKGLLSKLTLYDGRGQELDISDSSKYAVAFYAYEKDSDTLVETSLGDAGEGPVMLQVTPLEGSGYDTSAPLQEWILIKGKTGSVTERYCDNANDTWSKAIYANGDGRANPISFNIDEGFGVAVSSGDLVSALSAVPYAGLSKGPVSVVSSDANYGFGLALNGSYYSTGYIYGGTENFSHADGESISDYVASNYVAFNKNRNRWGIDSSYSWGDTAVLVNPSYLNDVATAAASYAYANSSPIFYTEYDGTLGANTAACLKDFAHVLILGDATMVPDSTVSAVQKTDGFSGDVSRLSGVSSKGTAELGNACSLSLAVAELLTDGDDAVCSTDSVSIVVASGGDACCDVVGAMNFSGHEDGITLIAASTADAKRIVSYLKDNSDSVTRIRLFGRSGDAVTSDSFSLKTTLDNLWNGSDGVPAAVQGEQIELYGTLFTIGESNSLATSDDSAHIWGLADTPAGSYPYGTDSQGNAVVYTLSQTYTAPIKAIKVPAVIEGLVYNGSSQIGVAAGDGYAVTGGSATDAGSYTAVVTLDEKHCWEDGTSDPVELSWSIATASLDGASVKLDKSKVTYTGVALTPAVASVTLPNLAIIPSGNYSIAYTDNIAVGTATVTVTGIGNCVGTAQTTFKIVKAGTSSKKSDKGKDEDEKKSSSPASDGSDGSGYSSSSSNGSVSDGATSTNSPSSPVKSSPLAKIAPEAATEGSDGSETASDEWTFFSPTSAADDTGASQAAVVISTPPALGIALMIICCLLFAAAIFYSTHSRKETDDLLEGSHVA